MFADILADAMLDGFVIGEAVIQVAFICVEHGAYGHISFDAPFDALWRQTAVALADEWGGGT